MQAFRVIFWSVKESLFQSWLQTEPKLSWMDQSHMKLSLHHHHHHHIFTSSTTASFILRHGQSHAAYWAKMFVVKKRGPDEARKAIESLSLCFLIHLHPYALIQQDMGKTSFATRWCTEESDRLGCPVHYTQIRNSQKRSSRLSK